jgi:hypothetical protein
MSKKLTFFIIILTLALSISANAQIKTLHEESNETILSNGITMLQIQKNTSEGPLDIHIIKIDLQDEQVDLRPIYANKTSVRKPLTAIADQWKVAAAVNGDFFHLGNPSYTYGTLIDQDEIVSSPNSDLYRFPTIIKDGSGYTFSILKPTMRIVLEDGFLALASINKIGAFNNEVTVFNSAYGDYSIGSTSDRQLVEIVVDKDVVKKIYIGKPSVEIPKTGYVIAFNVQNESLISSFKIGDKIQISLDLGFDLSNVDWAAGGVNYLVKDGEINEYHNSLLGRHPRTALGIDKEEKYAYLVTVDGRTTESVGLLQSELAELLLELGCFNVINLDGGGSTEMVVDLHNTQDYTVVNNPSDGSERYVVSGFGAFNYYADSNVVKYIRIVPSEKSYFKNQNVSYEVLAYNKYFMQVPYQTSKLTISASGLRYRKTRDGIYFTESGTGVLKATYNKITHTSEIKINDDIEEIYTSINEITIPCNSQFEMPTFIGVDKNGNTGPLNPAEIEWSLSSKVGSIKNDVLTAAQKSNTGILEGKIGNAKIYMPVYIGYNEKMIQGFEKTDGLIFKQYPEDSNGKMMLYSRRIEGRSSLKVNYDFSTMKPNDQSIAFVEFGKLGLFLQEKTESISMQVFGDKSGHWLRCRVTDANGQMHKIDFEREIDWYGWKEVTAQIPKDMAYPIVLNNIYVAEIDNEKADKGSIYIDRLIANYPQEKIDPDKIRQNTKVEDNAFKISDKFDFQLEINHEGLVTESSLVNDEKLNRDLRRISIDISNGGISLTNALQWDMLIELKGVSESDIVISFNHDFNQLKYSESIVLKRFFGSLMQNGNHVFIVYPGSAETQANVVYLEGVRYIEYSNYFKYYHNRSEAFYYYE